MIAELRAASAPTIKNAADSPNTTIGAKSAGVSSGSDDALGLPYLIRLLRHQWRFVSIVTVTIWAVLSVLVLSLDPRYSATALLVVDPTPSELLRGTAERPNVDTEIELMRSMMVVAQVAARLARDATPGNKKPVLPTAADGEAATTTDADIGVGGKTSGRIAAEELYVLERKFVIRRRGLTDVIAVEATAETPMRAAELANTYAAVYIEQTVSARLHSIERLEAALSKRVDELKAELAQPGVAISLRALHADYLDRLKQISHRRSTVTPALNFAARALPLDQPSFPSRLLLLSLCPLAALIAGIAIAIARNHVASWWPRI